VISAGALKAAAHRLAAAGIEDPMREARILAREAPDVAAFDAFVARRVKREPVAYILGRREFWSLEFEVSPAVLIPRPDTETVVEAALAELKMSPPARILDLGTGSGAILVALLSEWPRATGIGIDKSEVALAVAGRNAERNGVAARVAFHVGDWTEGITERFDLVVSNPPYVTDAELAALDPDVRDHEPALALAGGVSGLDSIERIAAALPDVLAPKGRAIVEIGCEQGATVSGVFTKSGLEIVRIARDLAGRERAVVARLPQKPGACG
jgi:release factor glutamine methyltransferase